MNGERLGVLLAYPKPSVDDHFWIGSTNKNTINNRRLRVLPDSIHRSESCYFCITYMETAKKRILFGVKLRYNFMISKSVLLRKPCVSCMKE